MSDSTQHWMNEGVPLRAGKDVHGEQHMLGVSQIAFKVVPRDEHDAFIIENIFHAPGGPARHLHHAQEEWFYAVEGQFVLEVGEQRYELGPGDSLLAPRGVPHVWACVGDGRGRMLIAFLPAGQMVDFFREAGRAGAMPRPAPAFWQAHGMELVGPPLSV